MVAAAGGAEAARVLCEAGVKEGERDAQSFVLVEGTVGFFGTLVTVLEATADRPAAQRLRPLAGRARRVGLKDAHRALGVEEGDLRAEALKDEVLQIATEESGDLSHVVLFSVAQGDGSSLAMLTTFTAPGYAPEKGALLHVQPSAWFSELPVPKPKKPVEKKEEQEPWLYCTRKGRGRSGNMPAFDWTGALRPFPISPTLAVPRAIARPDYADTGYPKEEIESRMQSVVPILDAKGIEGLRKACHVGRLVIDAVARAIKPGVTTDFLDKVAHETTIKNGGYPSPLNYHGFPKSCCTSVNEVVCHGIPDARALEDGDIVNIDISVYVDGYHGDLNETYLVGDNVDEAGKKLVRETLRSLEKSIALCRPGTRFRDIGDVVTRHAQSQGLSVVKTYCGHGIGTLFHCAPNIPHYAKNKAVGVMRTGMAFTIEPMINEGGWRDTMWPDGWTAVTSDGSRSAQFEHTMVVTDTGVEILTGRLPDSPAVFPFV